MRAAARKTYGVLWSKRLRATVGKVLPVPNGVAVISPDRDQVKIYIGPIRLVRR